MESLKLNREKKNLENVEQKFLTLEQKEMEELVFLI